MICAFGFSILINTLLASSIEYSLSLFLFIISIAS